MCEGHSVQNAPAEAPPHPQGDGSTRQGSPAPTPQSQLSAAPTGWQGPRAGCRPHRAGRAQATTPIPVTLASQSWAGSIL